MRRYTEIRRPNLKAFFLGFLSIAHVAGFIRLMQTGWSGTYALYIKGLPLPSALRVIRMDKNREAMAPDIGEPGSCTRQKAQRVSVNLSTVTGRDKLPAHAKIHWHKIGSGRAVGFKKMGGNSIPTWHAQIYDPATRRQTRRSLGTFDDVPGNKQFDEASKATDRLAKELAGRGKKSAETVKSVCEAYVRKARENREFAKADDAQARFKRLVDADAIGSIEIQHLTEKEVKAWKTRLMESPALVNPGAKKTRVRERSLATVNRDMTPLRSALNAAKSSDVIGSDRAWAQALKPFKGVGKRREGYLTRDQRREWLSKCEPDAKQFLRALSLIPLRPGAMARLTVASHEAYLRVLTISKDKNGIARKIMLPVGTAEHLLAVAKGKEAGDLMFLRSDGSAWDKKTWNMAFKLAASLANLPKTTVAYNMRHSVITDLVHRGLPLLTVAQLAGTSVAMIEQHYGHLLAEISEAALATLMVDNDEAPRDVA